MRGARMLQRGRQMSESRMSETVTAGVYKDGTDENGDATRVLVTERYAGKGRIKYESLAVSDSDDSSQVVASQTPMLSVPTGSPVLHEGDEVHVTASEADEALVGRFYGVEGAPQSGQTTSLRYPLRELS